MHRLLIAALVVSSSSLAWAAPPAGGPGPSTRVLAWTNIIEQADLRTRKGDEIVPYRGQEASPT